MRTWLGGLIVFIAVFLVGCQQVDEVIYVDNPVPPAVGVAHMAPKDTAKQNTAITGASTATPTSADTTDHANDTKTDDTPDKPTAVDDDPEIEVPVDTDSPITAGTVYHKGNETIPVKSFKVQTVSMKNLRFNPATLSITLNTTVVWVNDENPLEYPEHNHKIAAHFNEFRSGILKAGQSYNHTFTRAGVFTYIDAIYPDRMNGKITVT